MTSLESRVNALETRTEAAEAAVILIYRDAANLAEQQARTTARVLICLPDNHRDEVPNGKP
jgi:hypothetical protein